MSPSQLLRNTVTTVLLLAVTSVTSAQETYKWTISASDTDPFVNTTTFVPGIGTFYLWLACEFQGSEASAAEFGLFNTDPANSILTLTTLNGWLNAGTATDPLLAVAGCPTQSLVASILVLQNAPGQWCFRPSAGSGNLVTVDCAFPAEAHPMAWTGLSQDGSAPCAEGECGNLWIHCGVILCNPDGSCYEDAFVCFGNCDCVIGIGVENCEDCLAVGVGSSVEGTSWGRTKGLYR